jgi:uncharacterized protein (TIGR00369 family)
MNEAQQAILKEMEEILQGSSEAEQQILSTTLKAIRQKRHDPGSYLSCFLGVEESFIDEKTYQIVVPVTPFMLNPLGIVHGGITASIADTAMGMLVTHKLPDHQDSVTTEMKLNYISPGIGKKLICQAVLLHMGRKLSVCECKITNEKGRLIATASGSFYIIDKKK